MEKTKEDFSQEINKLLGTSIDFAKLTKEDLAKLNEAIVKIKEATEFPLPLLDKPLSKILDQKVFNKPLGETSLRELLGLPKGKGLFGFGLLPRFLSEKGEQSESKT